MQAHKALLIPVGLFVTALATWVASYFEGRVIESHFQQTAQRYSVAIEKELAVALESMHILKGLYDGSQHVDADEFAAATKDIYRRHQETISFSWLEPAADSVEGYNIAYMEPNALASGGSTVVDHVAHIPNEFFQKALDSGEPTLVETLRADNGAADTLAEGGMRGQGLHILVPVYKPVSPTNLQQRRANALGVVVGCFSFDDLLFQSVARALDPDVNYSIVSKGYVDDQAAQTATALFAVEGGGFAPFVTVDERKRSRG